MELATYTKKRRFGLAYEATCYALLTVKNENATLRKLWTTPFQQSRIKP